jgi:hypothetical protein
MVYLQELMGSTAHLQVKTDQFVLYLPEVGGIFLQAFCDFNPLLTCEHTGIETTTRFRASTILE